MLFLQALQLIAHSAATWTVQSRPNFSIHRHKRKLTPSLCLSSATLTQALSLKHTVWLMEVAVNGHFWRFSYAMPPPSFLFVLLGNETGGHFHRQLLSSWPPVRFFLHLWAVGRKVRKVVT